MTQATVLAQMLKRKSGEFARVVPFNPATDRLLAFDFSETDPALDATILQDTTLFTHYINSKLETAGARYGIGGYAEHRKVYARSPLFGVSETSDHNQSSEEEPRRFHLGVDIWGKPHTAVMAPLDGIIHSFAFNDAFGDYGATIILTHHFEGLPFYTLYGHLSLNSIRNLREGERVMKGDIIGEFGIQTENGQWPPHLHFQVIGDLQGWKGDYPGVCRYSEREKWLSNCPDPDLILGMMQYVKISC